MEKQEELVMKTFRLEPSIWALLDEHRKNLGASDRTDALRILIRNAKVQPAKVKVSETAILQPAQQGQVEPDGDMVWA